MVEVVEDNKKKDKKGKKERKRKGDAKKEEKKFQCRDIEPTISYSALPLNYAYLHNNVFAHSTVTN